MRKHLTNATLVFVAFAVTCIAIATGSYFNSGLIMQVDTVSEMLVRAPVDVEDIAGTARNRQAALTLAEGLAEVFRVNTYEWATVENNLSLRRGELEDIRAMYRAERLSYELATAAWDSVLQAHEQSEQQARAAWLAQVAAANAAGEPTPDMPTIPPPVPPQPPFASLANFADIPIAFSESQQEFIVNMTDENFAQMWHALQNSAHTVQNNEVIHYVDGMVAVGWATEQAIRAALSVHALDRAREELAEFVVLRSLRSNAVPDDEINEQRFRETAENYEIEIIPEGAIIVDEGQIVTQDIYDILASLDMLAPESLLDNIYPMLGVFFLVAVLFLASLMYLAFYRKGKASNLSEAMLFFTLYLLTIVLVWTLSDLSFPFLPLLIFPMLVSILIDRRCAVALTFCIVLICFFIVDGDLAYLLFYSAAGMLFCMFSKYMAERKNFIWVGLLVSAVLFMLAVAVLFIVERNAALEDLQGVLVTAAFAAVIGILMIFLCMGSLPLWETFFGVVTPVKLLDLTNPTNALLRRLTIEAPGTYHHSLIVANLAETAAFDIGANAPAARVGGYYHDVGKLKNPHYFVENLDGGDNPHDAFKPQNSKKIIMSHVAHGLTLATEHRLPQFVRDIIKEHHGTTLMHFFYSKAKDRGENCDEHEYRYPYTIPQTRESACVMLADSVEAAVRSMVPKVTSLDEVEITIRRIIREKFLDGQLAQSELSIKDVTTIEQSFFRVLKGMYHERIVYPTVEEVSE